LPEFGQLKVIGLVWDIDRLIDTFDYGLQRLDMSHETKKQCILRDTFGCESNEHCISDRNVCTSGGKVQKQQSLLLFLLLLLLLLLRFRKLYVYIKTT
jgi:hypothetical protein